MPQNPVRRSKVAPLTWHVEAAAKERIAAAETRIAAAEGRATTAEKRAAAAERVARNQRRRHRRRLQRLSRWGRRGHRRGLVLGRTVGRFSDDARVVARAQEGDRDCAQEDDHGKQHRLRHRHRVELVIVEAGWRRRGARRRRRRRKRHRRARRRQE